MINILQYQPPSGIQIAISQTESPSIFQLAHKIVKMIPEDQRSEIHFSVLEKITEHISFFQTLKKNYPKSILHSALK